MTFKLIPAIDILDGQLVRLRQGNYDQKTTYTKTPLDIAHYYQTLGLKHIHIVDLNGAVDGQLTNLSVISEIINSTNLSIQVGGGVRSFTHVETLLSTGVNAVIIGSLFIKDFDLTKKIINHFPNQIIAGLDIIDGELMTHGWTQASQKSLVDMLTEINDLPIHSVVTTDISKDGMMTGPNLSLYKTMNDLSSHPIIASGGVSSISDIHQLKNLSLPFLSGCIVGKAIIEGHITPQDVSDFL